MVKLMYGWSDPDGTFKYCQSESVTLSPNKVTSIKEVPAGTNASASTSRTEFAMFSALKLLSVSRFRPYHAP